MSVSADVEQLRLTLQRIASLLSEAPEQAAVQAEEILKTHPGQPNATTLLAAARRRTGDRQSALKLLNEVIKVDPRFALAHQERAFTLIDLGQAGEAEAALETAVELEPEMQLGWKVLGDLRAARGDQPGSEQAYQSHVSAVAGDPELVEAAKLLFKGKLAKAEQLCREYLKKDPADPSAIRMLAEIGIKLGRVDDAEKLLRRCLELAPDFHLARSNYANVLFKKLRYESALAEIEKALNAEPEHPSHLLLKASILGRIGDMEGAIAIYGKVLRNHPQQPRAHLSLGHVLKTVGRQEAAIESYRTGIALRPGLGEAYWSLANLKTFQFTDDELALMKDQVTRQHETPEDYFNLYFALGKAQEDRGQFDEAFHSYEKGNAIRRRTVRWDADEHHENTERLKRFFTSDLIAQQSDSGCASDSPIFIVGLPRSGSTLLEQILASHSQVEGTMELPDIISIARRLSGKKSKDQESLYPQILAEMNRDALGEIGEEYLRRTAIYRTNAPRFIDKMPNNFTHVGLIHLILPNARIIDARRNPVACCFSGYKQLFAAGQNFSYNLTEIGRYYRDYVDLMEHWDRVLPDRVLRVTYEEVVADIEGQVRRLLEHCGLPFESACLEFHRTERAVRTASSEQVRQPIYQEAVEQWRQFEAHLDSLMEALGPKLTTDFTRD